MIGTGIRKIEKKYWKTEKKKPEKKRKKKKKRHVEGGPILKLLSYQKLYQIIN